MQYHFFKGPEKEGAWKSLDAANLAQRIDAPRIAFVTVLSVSQKPKFKQSVTDEAKYQGPFYIDIDSDDIGKAIKAAKTVLQRLHNNGVKDHMIQIFATGKRGFHFLIPMKFFAKDEAVRKLPLTYAKMAFALKLPKPETDLTVYSHGRGRMWRVTNKQRIDNGKFKVQITAKELREMSPEMYLHYCSEPRPLIPASESEERCSFLEGLYNKCHAQALEATKPITVFVDPHVVEGLQGELPPCGQQLLAGENLDEDKGFNEKSTQFGKMVAMFGVKQGPETLIDQFAHNVEGTSYNTPEKRKEHTMKAYRIAASNSDYAWSCRSMLSILDDKMSPCLECPVAFLLTQQDDLIAEAEEEKEKRREAQLIEQREKRKPKPNRTLINGTSISNDDGFPGEEESSGATGDGILNGHRVNGHGEIGTENASAIEAGEHGSASKRGSAKEGELGDDDSLFGGNKPAGGPSDSIAGPRLHARGNRDDDEQDSVPEISERDSDEIPEELEQAAASLNATEAAGGSGGDGNSEDDESSSALSAVNDNDEGLIATTDGYKFSTAKGDFRKVTNFLLNFQSVILEHVANVKEDRRTALTATVIIDGRPHGKVLLDESAWKSKANFISFFDGLKHAGFYGKDEDLQKMKTSLMKNIELRVENIRRTYSVGQHLHQIGDTTIVTYVEPGWSINNLGEEQTYQLSGQVRAAPNIRDADLPSVGDPALREALLSLMGINSSVKIAQILGWFCASFLKQHINHTYNQFPLMGFGGPAGSGKSNVATLMSCLHGIDYRGANSPTSLPQATGFAVWKTIQDSMSCPRIMEEYNKSKLPRNYIPFGEVFKDCWNQLAVQRGSLSDRKKHGDNQVGAHITEFPMTAPVLVIAEQMVTMPALVERMVQVPFAKADLSGKDSRGIDARTNFRNAVNSRTEFWKFAKAANMAAVSMQPQQAAALLERNTQFVPQEMGDRPQFAFKTVLAGLDFFSMICKHYKLDLEERIDELRASLVKMLEDDIGSLAVMKQRTEVDIVMDKLATMAAMSDSTGAIPWLVQHEHYLLAGEWLYIDGLVALAQYRSFCARVEHSPAVIEDYHQFTMLLRGEPYCDSTSFVFGEDFARGRKVLRLNLQKMAEKGIAVDAFVA